MELYTSIESNSKILPSSTLTIGTFDGMHRGHLILIEKMVQKSISNNNKAVLVTFSPNPHTVINNISESEYHLLSKEEKYNKMKKVGVDVVLDLTFDLDMSKISADDFLKKYLIDPFNPSNIIIGYDHHFGYKREGDADFLKNN